MILWHSRTLYKKICDRSSKIHREIDFWLDSWYIMTFLILPKMWQHVKFFLTPKRCQNHNDLNRFHDFWADYISVYWGKLANYHVMENECIDFFNVLSFQPKCPFRCKIQLVPSCCGITLKLPEIALQKELYESFLMRAR